MKTIVFIDYANIKAWAREKNLSVDLVVLREFLINKWQAEKIIFYYGTDQKNPKSKNFLQAVGKMGYEIKTKPVKYFKLSLLNLLRQRPNQEMISRLNPKIHDLFLRDVKRLEAEGFRLFQPKANFDVEICLDVLLSEKLFDSFIIFSGDSDLLSVVRYLKKQNKKIVVIAGKKYLSDDLVKNANSFYLLDDLRYQIKNLLRTLNYPKPRQMAGFGRKVK